MKSTHQGFGTIALLVIIGIVLITTSGSYVAVKRRSSPSPQSSSSPDATPSVNASAQPTSETRSSASISFSHPYPVSWQDYGINYSITSVSIGSLQIPSAALPQVYSKAGGGYYEPGEWVYALAIDLKIQNDSAAICPQMTMRRLINEEGDFVAPLNRQFYFSGHGGCQLSAQITETQKIFFAVSESEREFTFTTGGRANIFFTSVREGKQGLRLEKISTPAAYATLSPTPRPFRSPTPSYSPLAISWTYPQSAVRINRGESITLRWTATGGRGTEYVYAGLASQGGQKQSMTFKAHEGRGDFVVKVPPGIYELSLRSASVTVTKQVSVEVNGQPPRVDVLKSLVEYYDFETGTGVIVANGTCSINVLVTLEDEFGFAILGKKVEIISDRGALDTIYAKSNVTDEDGVMAFSVASNNVGVSVLTARVEGVELNQKLVLRVLDPKEMSCPNGELIQDYSLQNAPASRDARRITDIKQLQLALELYFDGKGNGSSYPVSLDLLATNGYIPAIPSDPLTREPYYYIRCGLAFYHIAADLENAGSAALASDADKKMCAADTIQYDDRTSCKGTAGRYCFDATT